MAVSCAMRHCLGVRRPELGTGSGESLGSFG
jgi:hypothetical protein